MILSIRFTCYDFTLFEASAVSLYYPDVVHGNLPTFFKVLEAAADFFVEGAGDHMGSMLRETLVRLAKVEGGGHNNMMKDETIAARKKAKVGASMEPSI